MSTEVIMWGSPPGDGRHGTRLAWLPLSAPSSAVSAPWNGPASLQSDGNICDYRVLHILPDLLLWSDKPNVKLYQYSRLTDTSAFHTAVSATSGDGSSKHNFSAVFDLSPPSLHPPLSLCLVYGILIGLMCPYGQCQVAQSKPTDLSCRQIIKDYRLILASFVCVLRQSERCLADKELRK